MPKLADTGSIHVVASAATDRFSRPAPCTVGPMSCKPVAASLTTKSARLTSADLTCAGDQDGWSCNNTAADPAICGVAIDVPVKNAHPVPSPGQLAGLPTHEIELRTLTATEVTSGLMAKSTAVGPWPLLPYRISLLRSDEFLVRGVGGSRRRPRCSQCCSFVLSDHDCRQVVVEPGRPGHCNGVSSYVVEDENGDGACRLSVGNLLAEGARPAGDDCELAGGACVDAGATVGLGVEKVERCSRQWLRSHQPLPRPLFRRPPDR